MHQCDGSSGVRGTPGHQVGGALECLLYANDCIRVLRAKQFKLDVIPNLFLGD